MRCAMLPPNSRYPGDQQPPREQPAMLWLPPAVFLQRLVMPLLPPATPHPPRAVRQKPHDTKLIPPAMPKLTPAMLQTSPAAPQITHATPQFPPETTTPRPATPHHPLSSHPSPNVAPLLLPPLQHHSHSHSLFPSHLSSASPRPDYAQHYTHHPSTAPLSSCSSPARSPPPTPPPHPPLPPLCPASPCFPTSVEARSPLVPSTSSSPHVSSRSPHPPHSSAAPARTHRYHFRTACSNTRSPRNGTQRLASASPGKCIAARNGGGFGDCTAQRRY